MNRRIAWFAIVVVVTAVLLVGTHQFQEELVLNYRVPPRLAQEVANIAFDRYIRTDSWETAQYFYYVESTDKRVDAGRLVRGAPALAHVVVLLHTRGVTLPTAEDYLAGRLKRVVTIGEVGGTWKRVRVGIGTYVSPVGAWGIDYILERRWWGWAIVDAKPHPGIS